LKIKDFHETRASLNPLIRRILPGNPAQSLLSEAATIIRQGGVVAFPTDTFYGLAVNPFDPAAVARLFKIKNRSPLKPILLLISGMDMLGMLVEPPDSLARELMQEFWPGPLTLILKAQKHLPEALTGGSGKIGIRLPDAALPIRLMAEARLPLTATSANLSGEPSPATAQEVLSRLGGEIDLTLDGGPCNTVPSSLLDMTVSPLLLLRKGRIPSTLLAPFLQKFS